MVVKARSTAISPPDPPDSVPPATGAKTSTMAPCCSSPRLTRSTPLTSTRAAASERVLDIARSALGYRVLSVAVLLVVADLGQRPVDWQLGEVGTAQPDELRVQVGEVAELQQRVVGEVDAGHHVGGVESHLLGLGEEVVGVAV